MSKIYDLHLKKYALYYKKQQLKEMILLMVTYSKFEKKILELLININSLFLIYLFILYPLNVYLQSGLPNIPWFSCLILVGISTLLTLALYEKYIPMVDTYFDDSEL